MLTRGWSDSLVVLGLLSMRLMKLAEKMSPLCAPYRKHDLEEKKMTSTSLACLP